MPRTTISIVQLDGSREVSEENGLTWDIFGNIVPSRSAPITCPSTPARSVSPIASALSPPPIRRNPSVLRSPCERRVSARQRQLNTPDRFIPSRSETPPKERHILGKSSQPSCTHDRGQRRRNTVPDPFSPSISRSMRMAERYVAITPPPSPTRPTGLAATRILHPNAQPIRTGSTGSVWNVGGIAVTEGVHSVSNGRGGRITSGTNAPHYAADFLRKIEPGDEEEAHERRLALAMNVDLAVKVLSTGPLTPISPPGSSVWKDSSWTRDGVVSRLCPVCSLQFLYRLLNNISSEETSKASQSFAYHPIPRTRRASPSRRFLLFTARILTHGKMSRSWSRSTCISLVGESRRQHARLAHRTVCCARHRTFVLIYGWWESNTGDRESRRQDHALESIRP